MTTQKTLCFLMIVLLSLPFPALATESPETLESVDDAGFARGNKKTTTCCLGQSSMVAADDGGVVVRVGEKLKKYDNALNLVKEVSLVDSRGE